ncbi:hypothetical protein [Phaeobacter sp. JH20_39]|uniref:hypothetical protein n=1 Tax=Phaeobacter sp. JH20_39 TaxID=3112496 RepID=UPI003A8B44A4
MKGYATIIGLLLAIGVTVQSEAQQAGRSEGLSRQILALKSALDSFSKVTNEKLIKIQEEVDVNAKDIAKISFCADRNRLYAPDNNRSDENGCVVNSGVIVQELTQADFVDTGANAKLNLNEFKGSYVAADIFELPAHAHYAQIKLSLTGLQTMDHMAAYRGEGDGIGYVYPEAEFIVNGKRTWQPVTAREGACRHTGRELSDQIFGHGKARVVTNIICDFRFDVLLTDKGNHTTNATSVVTPKKWTGRLAVPSGPKGRLLWPSGWAR